MNASTEPAGQAQHVYAIVRSFQKCGADYRLLLTNRIMLR